MLTQLQFNKVALVIALTITREKCFKDFLLSHLRRFDELKQVFICLPKANLPLTILQNQAIIKMVASDSAKKVL